MARLIPVTELTAPELVDYAQKTEAQLRNRRAPEEGVFIAESPEVIRRALDAGIEPLSILTERRHAEGSGAPLIDRCGNVPVYAAPEEILRGLTGYALTRGMLCAMRRPRAQDADALLASAHRVAVLENIVDATNLGAIFRSAAALGMDAVLLSPSCCDPLLRRAARVSMGTVFQVPWARLGEDPAAWPEAGLALLHAHGFATAALALREDSCSVDDPRLKAEDRLALLLGTEWDGLAAQTIADCDYCVRIPMLHGVDSLNVAAASAVAFWELRYRK